MARADELLEALSTADWPTRLLTLADWDLRRETFERRRRQRLDGADLLLAVEVVSPGSGRTDRVTKADEHAAAGIPASWLVHLDPPVRLVEHRLGAAGVPVPVDLDTLVD